MPRGQNQHVVKSGTRWAVRGAGDARVTARFSTQREAISHAQNIARHEKSDTKIHGRDGKIRAGNSYGSDPFPPRDKR